MSAPAVEERHGSPNAAFANRVEQRGQASLRPDQARESRKQFGLGVDLVLVLLGVPQRALHPLGGLHSDPHLPGSGPPVEVIPRVLRTEIGEETVADHAGRVVDARAGRHVDHVCDERRIGPAAQERLHDADASFRRREDEGGLSPLGLAAVDPGAVLQKGFDRPDAARRRGEVEGCGVARRGRDAC